MQRRRYGDQYFLHEKSGQVVVSVPGDAESYAKPLEPVIRFVLRVESFTTASISCMAPTAERLTFARSLIRDGLLEIYVRERS